MIQHEVYLTFKKFLATPLLLLVNSTLCTLVNDNFLTQLVSSLTRGDNIPGLVFTNNPSFVYNVTVVDSMMLWSSTCL